jgi:hypothetical protein
LTSIVKALLHFERFECEDFDKKFEQLKKVRIEFDLELTDQSYL